MTEMWHQTTWHQTYQCHHVVMVAMCVIMRFNAMFFNSITEKDRQCDICYNFANCHGMF